MGVSSEVMLPSRLCVRGLGSCAPVAARWNMPASAQPMRQQRLKAVRLAGGLLHVCRRGVVAVGGVGRGMFEAGVLVR
jgi:hypothetical protein